jgi:hypothetical protein
MLGNKSKEDFKNKIKFKNSSHLLILWAGISFFLPILLIYVYSYYNQTFMIAGYEIKKISNSNEEDTMLANFDTIEIIKPKIKNQTKTNPLDTLFINNKVEIGIDKNYSFSISDSLPTISNEMTDSTKHRILLIGDSECGGLCFPLNQYCEENGHKLVLSFVWNSATIFNFAYSDTITKIIDNYKPTYLFLVVGLNELYAKDLRKRKTAADVLAKKINGIPYTWIGPANYGQDFGINKVFYSSADSGCFFYTNNMELPRGEDGRHPNKLGYKIWMDSIASWIKISAKHKLTMNKPTKTKYSFKSKMINLNASNFRGY